MLSRGDIVHELEFAKEKESGRAQQALGVGVILIAAVFLYLHLFIPPFTPIWTDGDQYMFLEDAHKMTGGQVPYRDFLQVAFPATDYLYLGMFKVFGLRMWISDAMLVIVGTLLAYVSYFVSRRLGLEYAAALPPLLFLSVVYRERLDATHHWYSVLASMAALAILLDRRSFPRLIVAGVLCGIAAAFTQSRGLLVLFALAGFVLWEGRSARTSFRERIWRLLALAGSFAIALGLIVGPVVHASGLKSFIFSTLTFAVRYYPAWPVANDWRGYLIGLPAFLHWRQFPALLGFILVHALLPAAYLLFFWRFHRLRQHSATESCNRLLLLALVGSALFFSVASAPTWARLYYVSLPALILFVWWLRSRKELNRRVMPLLVLLAVILTIAYPITEQLHSRFYLDLPTGRIAFLNQDAYRRYDWVASHTRRGDYFFALSPEFYFPLDLRNPAPVQYVSPYEYTRPEQVQEVISGLEKHHVTVLLWSEDLDVSKGIAGDHLNPLRAYIRRHYRVVNGFPSYFEACIRINENL